MKQVYLFLIALFLFAFHANSQVQVSAKKRIGSLTINGNPNESDWDMSNPMSKNIIGVSNNTVNFGVLWDDQNLYVAFTVLDGSKKNDSQNPWDDDAIEVFIDKENNGGIFGSNDRQIIKGWKSNTIWEKNNNTSGIVHAWAQNGSGYSIELQIPWSNFGISNPAAGLIIGFDVACDDDDNGGSRDTQLMWAGDANNSTSTNNYGDLILTEIDTEPPTAPANLNASNISTTTLTLNWDASTDNIGVTGYDVYQDNVKINSSLVATTNYAVSSLVSGATYNYYVVAKDAAGNTANSNSINVTTLSAPDTEPPTAPANLNATNITLNSLTLNWTASTDNVGVTGYDVYRNNVKINGTLVTSTNFNVTGLNSATTYAFYVKAFDAAGNSTNSSSINATTLAPDTEPPTAPANVTANNILLTSLTLNWVASTDNVGVTGYDVYRDNVKINGTLVTSTNFNVTGLNSATTYAFYVKAFDAAGNSTNSSSINATTLAPDTQAPTAPSNLNATSITSATLTLNWTASTDNVGVAGYDVYRNGIKMNASLVTGVSYNVTGLAAATAYSFYVNAKDVAGNTSANSNTVNVTTLPSAGCSGTGAINFQKWNGIRGSAVSDLTSDPSYPNNPGSTGTLNSFEIPANSGNFYGIKVYGYICPPTTGLYTFWIASDDNSELWLSSNNNPASKVLIASVNSSTNPLEWNRFTSQKSVQVSLTAGQLYYVEALMKEDKQNDHMAVGWAKPGQSTTAPSEIIPGSSLLVDLPDTQPPTAPTNLAAVNILQASFIITWSISTDNIGVTGYDVYRNGVKVNSTTITGYSYTVSGLSTNTSYTMTVKAKDAAGNQTESTPIIVTTLAANPSLESFTMRTVIANQRMPHDLVYGPDNMIWYTERFGGTVSFVDPSNGNKTVVLTLGANMVLAGGQDGLMGLALHPQFLSGKPYAYISYTYQSLSSTVRKTRIERYTYDFNTKLLVSPVTVLEDIPGSNDHNSSRIAIGPDLKLYYSVGDMGAGQFSNISRANNAQNPSIYEGKILRLNTEPDGIGSWIPSNNPFGNAIYSLGHRNPQGLVWGNVNGIDRLFSTEHGPFSDDEVNVIENGRNYGWPLVAGYCDGNYNGRNPGGALIVDEKATCTTLNVREPLRSLFPAVNPPTGGDNLTWPSVAPSGTEFYGSNGIPGWQNSLLIAELKRAAIMRLKLSNDGLSIISDTIQYFQDLGRFRDVVVSPDGLKIYVACDSSGSTSGPTGSNTGIPANPGSILEFTYSAPGMFTRNTNLPSDVAIKEEINNTSIDVYPNPARDFFIVYNYKDEAGRKIELYDLSGRKVRNVIVTNRATRIETQNLISGIYILRVSDKAGKILRTEKILVYN